MIPYPIGVFFFWWAVMSVPLYWPYDFQGQLSHGRN